MSDQATPTPSEPVSYLSDWDLRFLFDHNSDAMWIVDLGTLKYLEVNQAAIDLYGYSREEFRAMNLMDIRPPSDQPRFIRELNEREVFGLGYVGIWRHLRKDGRIIHVEVRASRRRIGGRDVALGIGRDVTEQVRAEEQSRYLAALVANISDAIISTDLDLKVLTWNPAAERMYGWAEHEVIGRLAREVLLPEYPNSSRDLILATFQNQGDWRGEAIHRHRNGSRIHVLTAASTVRDSQGAVIANVAIIRDITQQKRDEERLRQYNQQIEALSRRVLGIQHGYAALTPRERQVLDMIGMGMSNNDIARHFVISVRTVESHRASLMRKLDIPSYVELLRYAILRSMLI